MAGKSGSNHGGSGAATSMAPERSVEFVLSHADNPAKFCTAVGKLFGVRATEVALLKLEKGLLRFLFPDQLKTAGSIPVSSSSSVAAHTASTKKTELFNTFARIKHARVFETVKLTTPEDNDQSQQAAIQKLMSAPILDSAQKVVGVIQVCRKGFELTSAGPDFTAEDLQQLELAAKVASKAAFLKDNWSEKATGPS